MAPILSRMTTAFPLSKWTVVFLTRGFKTYRVFAAYLALSVGVWSLPLWGGHVLFYDTLLRLFFPYIRFVQEAVRGGEVPLWNPHLYSGVPFLANMQSALLYPATLLSPLLSFSDWHWFSTVAHTFLAAAFMFRFCRVLSLSVPASFMGGLCFGFNGFFLMRYAYPSQMHAYIWMPAAAEFLWRSTQRITPVSVGGVAVVLALQLFAGYPQFSLMTGFALAVLALAGAPGWKPTAVLAVSGALAIGISAVQWLPSVFLGLQSPRVQGLGYDWATTYSVVPREGLVMLFAPLWNYFFTPQGGDPHIVGFYWGWPVLVLAGVGLTGGNRRFRWVFGTCAAVGILFCLGRYLPGYHDAYRLLWPLRVFRFPAQFLYLTAFGLAALSALGLERMALKKRAPAVFIALGVLDLCLFAWKMPSTVTRDVFTGQTPTAGRIISAGAGRLLMAPRTRLHPGQAGESVSEAWKKVRDSLLPNLAMADGLDDADGYEELRLADYENVLNEMGRGPASPWLNVFNVRYIVSRTPLSTPSLTAMGGGTLFVYLNRDALPRAYVVHSSVVLPVGETLGYVRTHPKHPFGDVVLLEGEGPSSTTGEALPGPGVSSTAGVSRASANTVAVNVRARRPGWLVLADTYASGWSATVNGRPARVWRANYLQRAVAVPEGESVVVFHYWPPGLTTGLWIAAVTLGVAGGLAVWGSRPRAPGSGVFRAVVL